MTGIPEKIYILVTDSVKCFQLMQLACLNRTSVGQKQHYQPHGIVIHHIIVECVWIINTWQAVRCRIIMDPRVNKRLTVRDSSPRSSICYSLIGSIPI